jgi:hypothetical protein
MHILAQFLLRLAFGLACGMGITSSQKVASGFFRNHLYVILGLTTLAALTLIESSQIAMWLAIAAAAVSYIGSVAWLYESARIGKLALWIIVVCTYATALVGRPGVSDTSQLELWHGWSFVSSGLVLGLTFAAMLLGHWYLNAPGMELAPLRRLLAMAGFALVLQMSGAGMGLVFEISGRSEVSLSWLLFVLLRWSFGLFGVLALLWMARRTLDVPNTQSATGILYVAVLGVFVGELTGLLLSAESTYPL